MPAQSVTTPQDAHPGFPGFHAERQTYEAQKARLLQDEGKFIAIKGEELTEPRETYEAALDDGYQRFGLVAFLVRRIERTETPLTITRTAAPCRS